MHMHWASHFATAEGKMSSLAVGRWVQKALFGSRGRHTEKLLCVPTTTAASSDGWMIAWSGLKQLPNEYASVCPAKELLWTETNLEIYTTSQKFFNSKIFNVF